MEYTVGTITKVCSALKDAFPEDYTGILHGDVEAKDYEITEYLKGNDSFKNFVLDMWDEDPNKIREKFYEFIVNAYQGAE